MTPLCPNAQNSTAPWAGSYWQWLCPWCSWQVLHFGIGSAGGFFVSIFLAFFPTPHSSAHLFFFLSLLSSPAPNALPSYPSILTCISEAMEVTCTVTSIAVLSRTHCDSPSAPIPLEWDPSSPGTQELSTHSTVIMSFQLSLLFFCLMISSQYKLKCNFARFVLIWFMGLKNSNFNSE